MTFDYVIVGGGSAGLVLANRLSENPAVTVALLEAGGSDASPVIRIPAGEMMAIMSPKYNWRYMARPDASRNGREDMWPAGRVLGGGSSINGMMYVRGNRYDYDHWQEQGATGWGYADVLPYFNRAETNENGGSRFRGGEGPLRVSNSRISTVLTQAFIDGACETGIPNNPDVNGAHQEGVGPVQATQKRGWRHSTAQAYLRPAKHRPNLRVITGAVAERILFDGKRATGVAYRRKGQAQTIQAGREVILSAGAIASPKLLMLSGIGPAEHLKAMGIDVLHDSPGVGGNLQEHPGVMMTQHVNVPTLNTQMGPLNVIRHGLDFLFRGRGPASASIGHAVAFVKVHPDAPAPELQISYSPIAYDFNDKGLTLYHRPAIAVAVNVCRPEPRGTIRLTSADPETPPEISHELLGSDRDVALMIAGCRITRDIFTSKAFTPYSEGERLPGDAVQSDAQWEAFIREQAFLMYHPVGTCRMGQDAGAVVGPDLKVNGVKGLRIADASIMPTVPSANTNAPAIMVGEKASDIIRGLPPLRADISSAAE